MQQVIIWVAAGHYRHMVSLILLDISTSDGAKIYHQLFVTIIGLSEPIDFYHVYKQEHVGDV